MKKLFDSFKIENGFKTIKDFINLKVEQYIIQQLLNNYLKKICFDSIYVVKQFETRIYSR
jgi:hypothetical protein